VTKRDTVNTLVSRLRQRVHGFRGALRLVTFAVLLWIGLTLALGVPLLPSRYDLKAGDVSPYILKAPQRVTYVSQIRTREERAHASEAVADVYVFDPSVSDTQRQRLNDVLRQLSDLRASPATLEQRRAAAIRIVDPGVGASVVDDVFLVSDSEWRAVIIDANRVLDLALRNRITDRQLGEVVASLPALIGPGMTEKQAMIVQTLVRMHIKPTFLLDSEESTKAKRDAHDRVQPVRVTIEKGETILRDGDIVQDLDLERLEAIGLRNPSVPWQAVVATSIWVAIVVFGLTIQIHQFHPQMLVGNRRLILLVTVLVLTVLAARLTVPGRELFAYLFPVAASSMLIAVLLGPQLAFSATVVLAFCLGMVTGMSFEMVSLSLLSGLIGLLTVWKMERINSFLVAGIYVSLTNFAIVTAFHLFSGDIDPQRLALLAILSAANGALAAALALGLMSSLGHVFGIATSLTLLDLAHPTQPLHRRLVTDAPGTYYHSMIVANLCERAAEAVGADPLLSRVGAYYHDVGKTLRPYAFIENQVIGDNIHDRLDPMTSAQMIRAHVTEGLELARRHRLPGKVCDLISQHHGTRLVGFFYQKARESNPNISQQEFRYPGPRPQSREAAVMMLADSVEAAIRSLPNPSKEELRGMIQKVVADIVNEGQLDECDLTLRDLEIIRAVFASVLEGIHHPRIQYPKNVPPAPVDPIPVASSGAIS
jgi:cyclic-di-AMP phosphodiesterase PgpH